MDAYLADHVVQPEEAIQLSDSNTALSWLDSLATQGGHSSTEGQGTSDISSSPWSFETALAAPQPLQDPSGSDASCSRASAELDGKVSQNEDSSYSSESGSSSDTDERHPKKTRIALDPSQPTVTAQGQPRARVYVACHECRSRKVRCDGAKPICYNCHRRSPDTTACTYDSVPKRRGQDKAPGTRVRSAVGQRKHRRGHRAIESSEDGASVLPSTVNKGVQLRWHYENLPNSARIEPEDPVKTFDPSSFDPGDVKSFELPPPPSEEDNQESSQQRISSEPGVEFTRETWWDSLLMLYASEDAGHELRALTLTAQQRSNYTQRIFVDIRSLLRTSVYWASFIHLPRFFETLIDPTRRTSIQPSLILAMLAMGKFVQSSELRLGAKGREQAWKLIDQAHAALQASLMSQWIDVGLIQAAWMLAYYEIQVHPYQTWERNRSSFLLLDSLIRMFSLTTLDADLPGSRFSLFALQNNTAPIVSSPFDVREAADLVSGGSASISPPDPLSHRSTGAHSDAGCSCAQFTLRQQWPVVLEVAPLWEATTMWPSQFTEGELRKEECRRLVWSSVMLAAGHNSYTSARFDVEKADLYIKHYDNYALLLPGEALAHAGAPIAQNNIWSLYLRAMLLWHTGIRMRTEQDLPEMQRAQFAINAWLETEAIEDALNQHVCNLESRMAYQAREFIFNARMCISFDFQRYLAHVPSEKNSMLYRTKCETWLRRQMAVSQYLLDCLHSNPASELGTRSFLIYWFMGHVTRALMLWENDISPVLALEAAKLFAMPLEYLMQLWPSECQREKWQYLRYVLVQACLKTGVPPPSPGLPPPVFKQGTGPPPPRAFGESGPEEFNGVPFL
ncbi:hypothetical protein GY45DRAFT_1323136 [Cubamyces sp. BRFM 1775]|nr:hypothetical protein GY45DRAFT_1323136 [Cubamyces sp. BRFM 1775]